MSQYPLAEELSVIYDQFQTKYNNRELSITMLHQYVSLRLADMNRVQPLLTASEVSCPCQCHRSITSDDLKTLGEVIKDGARS